jgi:hypothetical protein
VTGRAAEIKAGDTSYDVTVKDEWGISIDSCDPTEIYESEEEARAALAALGSNGRIMVRSTYRSTLRPKAAA